MGRRTFIGQTLGGQKVNDCLVELGRVLEHCEVAHSVVSLTARGGFHMLTQLPNAEIIPLAHGGLGADELNITAIRDDSISALLKSSESHVPQPYWFRCPACNFDWREWIGPSIIFVSLSFVIDTCPNCGRKYVTACRMGSIKARE